MIIGDLIQSWRQKRDGTTKFNASVHISTFSDGAFLRQDDDEGQAIQKCAEAIEAQALHMNDRSYFWTRSGKHMFSLYYADGWFYDIVGPSTVAWKYKVDADSFNEAKRIVNEKAGLYDDFRNQ